MIGSPEQWDYVRHLSTGLVADRMKSISCNIGKWEPMLWDPSLTPWLFCSLFIVPELKERQIREAIWCQLAKAESTWLFSASSMVDTHQWELTWDTKIFTLCSHSYRHIQTSPIFQFFLFLVSEAFVNPFVSVQPWTILQAICHNPWVYILTWVISI